MNNNSYFGWTEAHTIYDISQILFPEIILAVFAMVALIAGVYGGKDKASALILWITVGMFCLAAFYIGINGGDTNTAFGGAYIDDSFSRFLKILILLSSSVVLIISKDFMIKHKLFKFEYPILVTLSVVGMMLMVSAGDLMSLYMALELQSLSLYVLAACDRDNVKSTEAGLKYFVLGALSSGLLLYGASLVYGYSGSTLFSDISLSADGGQISLGLIFGLIFITVGLAFKVSAVPFHMWTPDVYEGAPSPITAFFATAPKVAAIGLFARVVHDAFGGAVSDWSQILVVLSALSMLFGSFAAIGQRNIKRLMAYSSIAHMGFALMGLATGTVDGVQSMLVYMTIYIIMNIGVFSFILSMEKDGKPVTSIESLKMYSRTRPGNSLALLVLMFSLAGVPPLLGFFGKFYVLKAALNADLTWLAVSGVLASVIGAFYYIRIVFYMYFGEEVEGLDKTIPMVGQIVLIGSALAMLFGVINLFGIEAISEIAARSLVN